MIHGNKSSFSSIPEGVENTKNEKNCSEAEVQQKAKNIMEGGIEKQHLTNTCLQWKLLWLLQ